MKKGFTLVEVVVIILILGIAIPVLLNMFAETSRKVIYGEASIQALFYAQELMEIIKSKRFDENISPPWTSSAYLGTDSGEDPHNSSTFDDVDDFVNCTDPSIIRPQQGYTRSVRVDYVILDTTTTPNQWQPCGEIVCGEVSNCTQPQECCYKRITVSVSRDDRLLTDFRLTTIIAGN